MELSHAKNYYLFPMYPMLFAGGAVLIEQQASSFKSPAMSRWSRVPSAGCLLLVAGSLPLVPLVTWMLSPQKYIAYENALGIKIRKSEVHHEGPLPQPIGDQFGWPEMASEVAAIYHALPPEERAQTGIWAGNYGEAGAINLFGPRLGLPRAWSRHQNHWYWGPPPVRYTNFIVLQWDLEDVRDNCTSYRAFNHYHPFGMAEENTPVYFCQGAKFDVQKIWWHSHHWN
jgi:hypothetical protein